MKKKLEENSNSLGQFGRRSNLEITGIPDDVDDHDLEEKVIEVLDKTDVNVSSKDIEACHRIGKSKTPQKRQSYDLLIENTEKSLCQQKRFEKHRYNINRFGEIARYIHK